METLYRKVAVSERLPDNIDSYYCILKSQKIGIYDFYGDKFESSLVKYWLEEIDNTAVIQTLEAEKKELLEMLEFIYGYGEKVNWEKVRPDLESLIKKHKQ